MPCFKVVTSDMHANTALHSVKGEGFYQGADNIGPDVKPLKKRKLKETFHTGSVVLWSHACQFWLCQCMREGRPVSTHLARKGDMKLAIECFCITTLCASSVSGANLVT